MRGDSDRKQYGGNSYGYDNAIIKKSLRTKSPSKPKNSSGNKGFKHEMRKSEKYANRNIAREEPQFNKQLEANVLKAKQSRLQDIQEGQNRGQEFFNQHQEGLTPQQRGALQYEAERAIQREAQMANRQLLGDQAQRGIVGRGGVGYAQQQDLLNAGSQAKAQVQRDLTNLDRDMALKKQAAIFNVGQGEAAQRALERQQAADELRYEQDKKRQLAEQYRANRQFSRI